MLEKTRESPLDCKEIQPVHPKGDQFRIFIERTDAEAETPIIWPPDVKNRLIWKARMLGKIEGGKRRGWQRMSWLDGIMMRWTWVWVGSGSWWWTGKPDVLQSIRSQRVGHDWVTERNWICFHLYPVIVQDVSQSYILTYFPDLLKHWGTLPFPSHCWMVGQSLLLSLVSNQNQIGPSISCIESSFSWPHMQLLSSLWATDLYAHVLFPLEHHSNVLINMHTNISLSFPPFNYCPRLSFNTSSISIIMQAFKPEVMEKLLILPFPTSSWLVIQEVPLIFTAKIYFLSFVFLSILPIS